MKLKMEDKMPPKKLGGQKYVDIKGDIKLGGQNLISENHTIDTI